MALPQVFRSSSTEGSRPRSGAAARPGRLTACLLALLCLTADASAAEPIPEAIVFNRDIRPILSDTCFFCHGPDQAKRKADLRLDLEAEALADHDGTRALVPGDLEASELYRRIIATDESERMPPADSGRHLDARQIELIKRWIEQGAKWQKHWSFIAPERPALPPVTNAGWARSDIDRFILARLEREGLAPSPEADKTTLIRRVTLDLTGLPPTPGEVDAFLADGSNEAYEKVVDRLLKSPRFGERMAARWLDAARYADTNGYQSDGERHMWRWRDWVIGAYNRNLPFDQFTIEQIAGDLLPNPSLDQRIATGFNRNHRGNAEGGIIPEEYAVEYVVDRVDTTSTVWLGLTMGCARCHDHKFDPLTQKEFYQFFALFNNVPERGKAVKFGNSPPLIKAPTPEQQAALAALQQKLDAAEKAYEDLGPQVTQAQAAWEQAFTERQPVAWTFTEDLLEQFAFDGEPQRILEPASTPPVTVASGTPVPPKAANEPKPEPGFQAGTPAFGPGRIGQAAEFDGQRFVNAGNVADLGYYDKFTIAAWVYPTGKLQGTLVSRMTDTPQGDGYYVQLQDGKVQVNLIKRWLDDAIRVESAAPLAADRWQHVLVTYDGSRVARGVQIYVDGAAVPLRVNLDDLNQPFNANEPLRIGAGNGPDGRFQGRLDDVRLYRRALTPAEAELVATPDLINEIVVVPAAQRTPAQAHKLHAYFLAAQAPEPIRSAHANVIALRAERAALLESFPTTMVMEELPAPRETHLLLRGEYDKPGERVAPGVPASLGTLPEAGSHNRSHNRLDFARWLVDPAHPLTARVAVNRYWQMFFGTGLVKTVDDFGSQGEWPSHPELLDWLAIEFIRTGWNVKDMHKLIAMSATYRQASRHTSELAQRDPDNRLLARGPRIRLSAEMIRDQALFASGLLVENVGGPSVLPYQPAGLWKELTGTDFVAEHGDKLYRRSLYIYWKRTIAPPSMMTFDASPRETCIVRETRTNTPLQALTLMNEVTFVEAARVLAQRVLKSPAKTEEERLTLTFRLVTGRVPSSLELAVLRNGLRAHRERFGANPDAARALISAGEALRDEQLNPAEHAAYAALAGLILNLDETVTNE